MIREKIQQESERALADEQLACFIEAKLTNMEIIEKADDIMKEYEARTNIKV